MVFRRKRSHFMRLYLYIKDRIYLHTYFQYKKYWDWLFIIFCINFVAWDIFDILKLQFVYEYKLYVWTRWLIDQYVFIDRDVLIMIMEKHKLLYSFYNNFCYYNFNNINIIFFCQIFKNIHIFKEVLLLESVNQYSWKLDILFTLSM
jgi:hypothetical protein